MARFPGSSALLSCTTMCDMVIREGTPSGRCIPLLGKVQGRLHSKEIKVVSLAMKKLTNTNNCVTCFLQLVLGIGNHS